MRLGRIARASALGSAITVGTVVAVQAPAFAFSADHYEICVTASYRDACSTGTISWSNRTAAITGNVIDVSEGAYTIVIFESFAGTTKIQSQTRTANEDTGLGGDRGFNFTIGDPDLVGGINRIKVTVRQMYPSSGNYDDSLSYQLHRDNVAESVGN
jgi:hypothetical protein